MEHKQDLIKTPWQKVHAKFNMSPSAFARALGRHRSKISRALRDADGVITGRDQRLILELARKMKIEVTAHDLTPEV